MPTRSAGVLEQNPARAGFCRWCASVALAAIVLTLATGHAATLRVSPDASLQAGGQTPLASLAEAVRQAKDGDTILGEPGEYRGDVALIDQKRLAIRGVGQRPVFIAEGRAVEGKAMLVVRGGDIEIENLEFRGARVPDGNGAGIRFEKGRLTLRRCAFVDNQMGVLTVNFDDAELVVEDSEFAHAPRAESPLPHLLYAGRIASLKVSGSRFHDGRVGHLLKSRARRTELAYNLIVDGPAGRASYEVDLPNGGDALLIGNVIGQSAASENRVIVAYGAEGNAWPQSRLRLVHNTLISEGARPAWFVRVWTERLPAYTRLQALNNLGVGPADFTLGAAWATEGNFSAPESVLEAADALDFAPVRGSTLRGAGVDPLAATGSELVPRFEFALPLGKQPLSPPARWSPGAVQR